MTKKYGETVADILRLLDELGPLSRSEMCEELGLERTYVSAVVTRMASPTKRLPKRIHVSHYVYDMEGARRYPRAVYALGDKPDARRPKANKLDNRRRADAKRRVINTANSVFNLATPRREYRL